MRFRHVAHELVPAESRVETDLILMVAEQRRWWFPWSWRRRTFILKSGTWYDADSGEEMPNRKIYDAGPGAILTAILMAARARERLLNAQLDDRPQLKLVKGAYR